MNVLTNSGSKLLEQQIKAIIGKQATSSSSTLLVIHAKLNPQFEI